MNNNINNIMRLFYTDYRGKPMLALEFSSEIDAGIYKRLLEDCQVKILYEYQQSKLNDSVIYPMSYKPTDMSLFTKILIIEGDRQDSNIQFLMWELEKRCKLENDFNLPLYEKKIVRKRRIKKETKDA